MSLPSLSPVEARGLAESFLRRYAREPFTMSQIHFAGEKRIELHERTDFEFTWGGKDTLLDNPLSIKVRVDGNRIAGFSVSRDVPAEYRATGEVVYLEIGVVVIIAALIIFMIAAGLKRIRSYEIGWRTGLILGAAAAALLAVEIFFTVPRGWNAAFFAAALFGPLFYGGALVLSWSISESLGREAWREKFTTVDLIMKGHLLDSRVAQSVLIGIATGAAANGLLLLGMRALAATGPVWFNLNENITLKYLPYLSPGVFLAAHLASLELFVISALFVFPMAFLRHRISSSPAIIVIVALISPLLGSTTIHPMLPGHLIQAASVAVILWSLSRFDVLTAYIGLVAAASLDTLPVMLYAGDQSISLSGYVVLGLGVGLIVAGWVGLITRDRVTDTDAIVPAFARHISERERMKHELQIARDVQMSLLPTSIPPAIGLDIAARCVPALEVGGDYYDFVLPRTGKLGIVVGDVSGKGTEGAFYMTLTKGFLKAVARSSDSPAEVLMEANSLFYENVARGNFISIIYALVDPLRSTVTIARAGHNPAILCRPGSSSTEVIQPRGIALGLEPGDVFSKTIEEVTLPFRTGDVLVLYTDGFVESMNRAGEQFGDERFQTAIAGLAERRADDIVEGILQKVQSFAGKAVQHDDMTIVVVRRTAMTDIEGGVI